MIIAMVLLKQVPLLLSTITPLHNLIQYLLTQKIVSILPFQFKFPLVLILLIIILLNRWLIFVLDLSLRFKYQHH
jgi:hypothetical protein